MPSGPLAWMANLVKSCLVKPVPPGQEGFEPVPPGQEGFEPVPPGQEGFKPVTPGQEGFNPVPGREHNLANMSVYSMSFY